MGSETKAFTSGRIRQADYDASTRVLELHFDGGRILVYKHVPQEVFRRLCSAPNPATYWEDRIAEEYPKGPEKSARSAGPTLKDLFGDPEGS
jgi:hypothetical protein